MLYGAMLSNQISRLQAEATQRYSEEQYRNLVENSNDAIYLIEDGWITFVNPRFAELFGVTFDDIRAKKYHMLDLVSPKNHDLLKDRARRLELGEIVPLQFELIAQNKNGVEFEIEVSVNHVVFQGRRITQGVARNITERKASENALRQSETRFRSMFEEARIGIVLSDHHSRMQSINPAFARMLGYGQDELEGMSFSEITHPEDIDLNVTLFNELFRGERDNYQLEKRYVHKNGNAIWTQVTVSRFPGDAGENKSIAMVEDITERKRTEAALQQSEERFRLMFENASIGIVLSNQSGYPVAANRAYINLLGYSKDELYSLSFGDLTHAEDLGKNLDLFETLMSHEIDHYSYEKRYIHKDGSPVWVRLNVTLFPVGEGEDPFTIAFVEDINERKQAERAAEESRKMLETVINAIPFRVFWKDTQSQYMGSNELFAVDAGLDSAEAVVGKTDYDLVWAHTVEELQAVDREVIESQIPKLNYDNLYTAPDGKMSWFRTSKTPLYNVNGDQLGVLGIYEDITERKAADTALQQSEARFRAVFEGANIGISVADQQGRIVSANLAFVQMLGYSADELKEMRFSDYSHPDDVEKNQAEFQKLMNDEIDGYFLSKRNIRKDGRIVWVHINVTRFPSSIGEDDYVIALMEDVTARKEAEKQALQLAVEQEKVQALAEFVRAASHDLKTPLSVINTSLYILERSDDPDKRSQKIETIDAQVKYLNKVINQLFTMSNLDSVRTIDFEPIRIDVLLRDVQEAVYDVMKQKNLQWSIETQTDLPPVEGNAEYLHEAVRNVVENAVRFCDDGGRIEARATCEGDTVLITIQDSGRGISEEDLPHIFERFYKADKARTHDNQGGSGMGLAITKKVFDIHNGDISAQSVPDEGTTITMRLPLAQSAELVGQ
jgi:PAS domain S-box-containing protein